MKKLTKLRLLNWYHILDETLSIEGSTLFMGDNGSGKSTILDAIQFALVADLTQVKFNQAANENATRNLQGYTRWMTNSSGGKESYQYNRGDCTTYVLLEFTEELPEGKHTFVIGAVIDSFKDSRDPRRLHFAANQALIEDIPVYREKSRVPLNISEFKKLMAPRKGFFGSTEPGPYRDDLLTRLGKLSPDFTKILVKAQAFKPLGQVQQFVMDFLLDDRPLETQSLQMNLSNYKGLEQKASEAERRVNSLEKIAQKGGELERVSDEISTFRFLELRAQAGIQEEAVLLLTQDRGCAETEKVRNEEECKSLDTRVSQCELEIGSVYRSLSQDSAYQERARAQIDLTRSRDEYTRVTQELVIAKKASERLEVLQSELKRSNLELPASASFRELSYHTRIQQERLQTELGLAKSQGEMLQKRLVDLERGVRNFPKEAQALKGLIEDQIGCEAPLLCELLEITDEKWQPAVEGYLNTRRFDIVLDPKHFQKALSLYEKMKRQLHIHGVGLVDAEKVLKTNRPSNAGTLGEFVSSENPWAKAYADFILGDLVRCESEKELRKHSRAITPTCMVYQNHAARQTPFHIFDTWHVGKRGHASQVEQTKREIAELHMAFVAQAELLEKWTRTHLLCEAAEKLEADAKNTDALQARDRSIQNEIDRIENHLKSIQTDHIDDLERRLTMLRQEKEEVSSARDAALKAIARAEQLITDLLIRIHESERLRDLHFAEIAQEFPQIPGKSIPEDRYGIELEKRSPSKIYDVYSNQRKGRESQKTNILETLTLQRSEYNNVFGFSAPAQGEWIEPYLAELKSWKESFLPEYQQKIAAAKDSALQQLMEDIVHKLRENLDQIPSQFEQINRALRGFHFGYDQYQFIYRVKREYQSFEKLVREAAEYERQPLFQTSWKERFKDGGALEALFQSLVSGSSAQVQDELKQYSDYREYYEYDLKILHADGTESLYSQVNRWKSGGETQAPYYIAVLASLYRLYRLRPEQGGKQRGTIGLVLLDEAFNKMDEDRLQATLKFTQTLGLQLLMATPKERAEFIIPHVESCWIVGKDPASGCAYLQDFHQDPISNASLKQGEMSTPRESENGVGLSIQ